MVEIEILVSSQLVRHEGAHVEGHDGAFEALGASAQLLDAYLLEPKEGLISPLPVSLGRHAHGAWPLCSQETLTADRQSSTSTSLASRTICKANAAVCIGVP